MAKCPNCGKKGLFLKLTEKGVCKDCLRLASIQEQEAATRQKLDELSAKLADKERYKEQVRQETLQEIADKIQTEQSKLDNILVRQLKEKDALNETLSTLEKSQKTITSNSNKVLRLKEIYKSIEYCISHFYDYYEYQSQIIIPHLDEKIEESLSPTVKLNLHCMDLKELRKKYKDNEKAINEILEKYKDKYTTKTNKTIYQLMVIALEAELQNVLYNINYGKLDKSIEDIKTITAKYAKIATEGNQTIVNTVVKFIGQIEYLFIEAVKIEYEYYVQKERIKEEQRALREQMRQEAEERRALEEQRKQVEKEEEKYKKEIATLKETMESSDDTKNEQLQQRISELEELLHQVDAKKEEITKLQHGKAGYVYIISNLGSFGDKMFKIGMTRRIEPQDRIDELGSASVPFPFDVHSFIFSDDAVGLENSLHKRLHEKRTNKVNLRKEFFNITVEELQQLVEEIEPTAEFKLTMLAEQYRQSLSIANGDICSFDEEIAYDAFDEDVA